MLFNKRAIAQVLPSRQIDINLQAGVEVLVGVTLAAMTGSMPDEIASALLVEVSENISIYADEFARRHTLITGHDFGVCSGKLGKRR